MNSLKLHLLGAFQATLNDAPLTDFRTAKARALLAYLAIEANRPHSRDALAALFWGESSEKAARNNLRVTLTNLRQLLEPLNNRALSPPVLTITNHTAQFHADHPACWIDVTEFDRLIAASRDHPHQDVTRCSQCAHRLTCAVDLYRGDFLNGVRVCKSPEFDQWRLAEQETRHWQFVEAVLVLIARQLALGDYDRAQRYARQLLVLEPWNEEAHRYLMYILTRKGQRSAALAQYQTCRRVLREELDTEPTVETTALYREIRESANGQIYQVPGTSESVRHLSSSLSGLTPFVGRAKELRELCALLFDPAYRLITVAGAGGVGKTRLVQAAARDMLAYFAAGARFVSLAEIHPHPQPSPLRGICVNLSRATKPGQFCQNKVLGLQC